MQITEKEIAGLVHSYQIVVPAADIAKQTDEELQALGKKVKMPGFRPGKVPLATLRQRYGKDVMGDVLQSAINNATSQLVDEKKLRPAMRPDINITSFEEGQDLTFDISLEVFPEVPAVDLSKISVEEYTFEVPETEVQASLTRLAKTRRHPHTKDGAAELGDVVKMDFLGKRDGVPFQGGEGKGFQLELGSGQFIPGFEEQLVGLKAGDTKTIEVNFPEAYHSADLAGQPATFDITVHEVSLMHTPELDDSLAEKLGFESLAKLTEMVKERLGEEYAGIARNRAKKDLFDKLDAAIQMPIPQGMLKLERDNIFQQLEAAQKANDPELAGKSEEELKAEYEKIAERRVRLGIYLSEVGRANNLQITRDEIAAAVMNQARNYPGQEQKVFDFYRKNPAELEELRGPILEDKAVDFVLSQVTRVAKPVTIEELTKGE